MTDHPSHTKQSAPRGAFSVLAWTVAWGLTGIALYISGVFNSPRTGPLWVALVGGAVPWAIAGHFTFRAGRSDSSGMRKLAVMLIWALAYLVAFALAAFAATALAMVLGGFFLMLVGWTLGGGAGAFASTWLLTDRGRFKRSIVLADIWMLGFFVGSFLALVGLYLGPEFGKLIIGPWIGQPAALALGAGVGCAVGGLAASAIAVGLTRLVRA
jgi:hypothetical protein